MCDSKATFEALAVIAVFDNKVYRTNNGLMAWRGVT
jgi:hypothetical protein